MWTFDMVQWNMLTFESFAWLKESIASKLQIHDVKTFSAPHQRRYKGGKKAYGKMLMSYIIRELQMKIIKTMR